MSKRERGKDWSALEKCCNFAKVPDLWRCSGLVQGSWGDKGGVGFCVAEHFNYLYACLSPPELGGAWQGVVGCACVHVRYEWASRSYWGGGGWA